GVRAIRGPAIRMTRDPGGDANDGAWPSGKARDFGSRIRRFESSRPNHTSSEAPMAYELKLLTGNANRPLAEEIGQYLRVPLADAEVTRFSDGEVYVQINENVRGADVFVIQPTCPPVDDLFAAPVIIDYLGKKELREPVIVAPDAGGVERARAIAKRLNASLAIIDKRREGPNSAVAMHLIGDVRGREAVVIDDMIDTASTLIQAVSALEREGARRILACGVHPVLSGPAVERITTSPLEEVVVTNSIIVPAAKLTARVTVLTVAPLLGEAIRRIHDEESVSTLFV